MKKGFTLIELLAVIVILAIIALIATPIVLNIINDTKESAILRSADFYLDGVEKSIATSTFKDIQIKDGTYSITKDGNICIGTLNNTCDGDILKVQMDGEVPNNGTITIESGKVTNIKLTYQGGTVTQNNKGELVLGDMPEAKSFAEDSWDTIAANVRAGNLSKYKVGDTKEITLTSEDTDISGTYTVRIANTSTPEECKRDGFSQTSCGFVIEFEDIISYHVMNTNLTNVGGWEASGMRIYVNSDILNSFPKELKENIIDTYVVSGYEHGKAENYKTTDKLYLLSTAEIWEQGVSKTIDYDTARDVTRQLDYYKNYKNADGSIGVTTNNNSGAIKKYNGNANFWWLRSAYSTTATLFYRVTSNGDWHSTLANDTYGVAVAFRL